MLVRFMTLSQKRTKRKQELGLNSAVRSSSHAEMAVTQPLLQLPLVIGE